MFSSPLPRAAADQHTDPAAILAFLDAVESRPDIEMHSLMVVRHGHQPCTYTLGSIVQRNAGMTLTEYLRPRLLDPLGIGPVGWQTWPPGRQQGFSGLFARTEDVAKLGLLYLQGGRWEGRQLLAADWAAAATTKKINTTFGADPDWQQGYGFQFWMARHGFRGDGAFGQYCVVLPEQDTVVAITGYTRPMQAVLDALWEHLLPGLGHLTAGAGAQRELDSRLEALALPAAVAGPAPAGWAAWTGAPFAVASAPSLDEPTVPAVTSALVSRDEGGWRLRLSEPGNSLDFPVGADAWAVSAPADEHGQPVPVAAAGGWDEAGRLRAEVIFLETPHRMEITAALPGPAGRARWLTPPMRTMTLDQLHCPS